MRLLLALALCLALAGCFEGARCKNSTNPFSSCYNGLSGVTAQVTYGNATWDIEAQQAALRALGFGVGGSAATVVVGHKGNETVRFYDHAREGVALALEFSDERGLGYTREEAQAMGDALILDRTPRAIQLVENTTIALGWSEPGPMSWFAGITVI